MKAVIIAGVLTVFIVGVTVFGNHGLISYFNSEKKLTEVEKRAADLEAENQRLKAEIVRLNDDLHFIEQVAREDLGMVKADEFILQLKNRAAQGSAGEKPVAGP